MAKVLKYITTKNGKKIDGHCSCYKEPSDLPKSLWTEIVSYLSLSDRVALACTCKKLNAVFKDRYTWTNVEIKLEGSKLPSKYKDEPVIIQNGFQHMISSYGSYFRHVTIKVNGYIKQVSTDCRKTLRHISTNKKLKSVTLDMGSMVPISKQSKCCKPTGADLAPFARLAEMPSNLESFKLISWPRFLEKRTFNILTSLLDNKGAKYLRNLSLYGDCSQVEDKYSYTDMLNDAILPGPGEILELVAHFTHITTLSLHSSMVTDNVIKKLAEKDRISLEYFSILVTKDNADIPSISSSAWRTMRKQCTRIQVSYDIMAAIPYVELRDILKPEIPLYAITFSKNSRCSCLDITSLEIKYAETLSKFVDHSEGSGWDMALYSLISGCKNLRHFEYNGKLQRDFVLDFAELRGQSWRHFSVNIDNVDMRNYIVPLNLKVNTEQEQDENCDMNIDDNAPIDGHSAVGRTTFVEELKDKVSQCLGYSWKPMSTLSDV